jgi:hypothetical protein
MPIVYVKTYSREMARANPEARFVFGDNAKRVGLGGQAKVMRGEPNAIGVATKWLPENGENAFFSDKLSCRSIVGMDLIAVQKALDAGRSVYVPADGLGTGLAELPQRAPELYELLRTWFAERSDEPNARGRPLLGNK